MDEMSHVDVILVCAIGVTAFVITAALIGIYADNHPHQEHTHG